MDAPRGDGTGDRRVPRGARSGAGRHGRDAVARHSVRPLGRAGRAPAPAQARARPDAAGQGRARGGGAHRAGRPQARRAVRAARERVPRRAGQAGGRTGASIARRPAGDERLPERPGEPVPPDRLSAVDRRGRRGGARVRVRLRDGQPDRAGARRARLPQGRQRGRRRRERRGRDGRRPLGRDVHERARLLRALPAARAGGRGGAAVPRGGRGPAQRLRRLLRRGGVPAELRADEPRRVRAHHAEVARVSLQRAAATGPQGDDGGARRPADLPLPGRERRAGRAGAAAAAVDRGPRARARVDVCVVGGDGALVLGPHQGPARAGRRGAPPGRGADARAEGRAGEGARRLRLRRAEDAVRGAGVRHPRLQAVPVRADLRARLRGLQRQGDAHRHDAPRARPQGDARGRAHGQQGQHRGPPREPRPVRPHDRIRAVARPVPGRNGRIHGHDGAAGDGPRRRRAPGQRGQREARAPARSAGERERERPPPRGDARARRHGADRLARGHRRRGGEHVARPLPRGGDAQGARAADARGSACPAAR